MELWNLDALRKNEWGKMGKWTIKMGKIFFVEGKGQKWSFSIE